MVLHILHVYVSNVPATYGWLSNEHRTPCALGANHEHQITSLVQFGFEIMLLLALIIVYWLLKLRFTTAN